jgi:uncharacterized protein YdaU (DUF1376 family)
LAWFAFDVDDYDADTMHLTAAEDGMYSRLLRFYYKTRLPLPDNDKALAAIARVSADEWAESRDTIRAFFQPRAGKLRHKRCDQELDVEDKRARTRSERASKAANARHNNINDLDATSMPQAQTVHDTIMLGDATRPDQTRQKEEATTVASKKSRKTQFPADWIPDEGDRNHASQRGYDQQWIDEQALACRDYHRGKGTVFSDLSAAWRTWVRNYERFNRGLANGSARQTPLEGLYAGAALALERREAQRQADRGTCDNAAEPLLDSRRGPTLALIANR